MAPNAPAAAEAEKVHIYHTGQDHGPLDTPHGLLRPGMSLAVPKEYAEKIVQAYRHIKLASDVIPGAKDVAAPERAKLQARIKELEAEAKAGGEAAAKAVEEAKAAAEKNGARATELLVVVQEFLGAKDKKALEALQEKHAKVLEPVA